MEPLEKITTLEYDVQAQLVDAILKERNIPHVMQSYHDSAYDGLYQMQKGWGHVEAPARFKEEILAILADIKRQSSETFPDPDADGAAEGDSNG
jgi:hypothetical protein